MLGWNFFINGTEVDEPIGWDGIEFTLKRSQNYIGLENSFSSKDLTFDGVGAQLIKTEFAKNGFDGTLDLRIEDTCAGKVESTTTWQINLMFFKNTDGLVSVNAAETGISMKLKNRRDIKVSLDSMTSIGGAPLLEPDYKTIGLHSKGIVKTGKMDFEVLPLVHKIRLTDFMNSLSYYFPPLFNRIGSDMDTFQLPVVEALKRTDDMADLDRSPYFYSPSGGRFKFIINLHSHVITTHHFSTFLRLVVGTGLSVGSNRRISEVLMGNVNTGAVDISTNLNDVVFEVVMLPGEGMWLYYDTTFTGLLGNSELDYTISYNNQKNSLEIEDLDQFDPPSTARVMLIHDVFARVSEILTDEPNCFKSEFFGLIDQYPFYQEDGCGSHTAITNGKNIRNMLQKDGVPFPVSMSFTDLYKSCDAIWNIGMRIEYNSFGKGVIRIEPKEYFFQKNSVSIILSHVSNITIKPATNHIFKGIEIGYDKWNLNQGSINGIDEFNTVHNYTLPLKNANNGITAKSKFIASGYAIELTRRVQYQSNTTTDFETDDENFFIALNPHNKVSSMHSVDGLPHEYKANTISETNENFQIVENLISPESAYNLRLSPARSLLRWWNYLSGSLFYKLAQDKFTTIKFQSGEGNVLMRSTQTGDCKEASNPIQENQDIMESNLDNPNTLFVPVLYDFEYPMQFSHLNKIRKKSNIAIQFNCDGVNSIVGFLEELTYKPAGGENGIGVFSVLVAAGKGAAFDDGFDDGFDV
jgi:hypothetical protein